MKKYIAEDKRRCVVHNQRLKKTPYTTAFYKVFGKKQRPVILSGDHEYVRKDQIVDIITEVHATIHKQEDELYYRDGYKHNNLILKYMAKLNRNDSFLSYSGKEFPLFKPEDLELFSRFQIENIPQLLEAVTLSKRARKILSRTTEADRYLAFFDFLRLKNVGEVTATKILDCGVNSMAEFMDLPAEKYRKLLEVKAFASAESLDNCVEQAAELNQLDLSIEYPIIREKYPRLFTNVEC